MSSAEFLEAGPASNAQFSNVQFSNAEYLAALRPLLPPEVLRPYWRALGWIGLHLAVVISGWIACKYWVPSPWWPLAGLGIAFSLSSLGFLAHDVTHRSVVRHPWLLYPTELVLWGIMLMPPTLYRRVHLTHHAYTNGDLDPDRRFLPGEINPGSRLAATLLFPTKETRWSLLCRLYWVIFPIRNVSVQLYSGLSKPSFATAKPRFSRREKIQVGIEIVLIVCLQIALVRFLRGAYLWAVVMPVVLTSLVTTWYLFTNHGLHPIGDGGDILHATTSVIVPRICDTLHSNFSYHAEHHLFPSVNPTHYPLISRLLRDHFPHQYHRIPMDEAWRQLWQNPVAASPAEKRG